MARFSIEDSLFISPAFKALQRKLGEALAFGAWGCCGRIAQEYWKRGQLIPKAEFAFIDHAQDLVDFGFLIERDEGFYFKGSEEHFAWLVEKIEAASKGGRSSAEARLRKFGTAQPQKTTLEAPPKQTRSTLEADSKHRRSTPEAPPNPLTPSPSLKLNLSKRSDAVAVLGDLELFDNRNLATLGQGSVEPAPKGQVDNPVGYFIGAYRKAFQERYPKAKPDLRGKVQGQIKAFLKDRSMDEAIQLIQAYCQMDGARGWFKTKGHDFGTFIENLNPISIALSQGAEGQTDWAKFWKERELEQVTHVAS